jgi:hypothetical protein
MDDRCALFGEPIKEVHIGEDGFHYCCEDHAYLTITALMVHLRNEKKLS